MKRSSTVNVLLTSNWGSNIVNIHSGSLELTSSLGEYFKTEERNHSIKRELQITITVTLIQVIDGRFLIIINRFFILKSLFYFF